jgi:hypothetical protein
MPAIHGNHPPSEQPVPAVGMPPPLPAGSASKSRQLKVARSLAPEPPPLPVRPLPEPPLPDAVAGPLGIATPAPAPPELPPETPFPTVGESRAAVCADAAEVSIDEEVERTPAGVAAVAIRGAPPWLVSAIVHAAILVLLALVMVVIGPAERTELVIFASPSEQEGEQVVFSLPLGMDDQAADDEAVFTPDNLPPVDDAFAAPAMLPIDPDGAVMTSEIVADQVGLALAGRQPGSKNRLLGRYGGTGKTEEAVQLGLKWLARFQNPANGSWSLRGPYTNGAPAGMDNQLSATAMALLALQGAGNTPEKGDFRRNVLLGWRWLLEQQGEEGNFFRTGFRGQRFYTDGQCAIALCELYAMTKDPQYKEPAQRVVKYLVDAQSQYGGWKYEPKEQSDVSVTGWIVMALQSAKMAGIEVPQATFDGVNHFLDTVQQEEGSAYPYERNKPPSVAMTAEALLIRQYLGWKRDDPRLLKGVQTITAPENLVNFREGRDVYGWYYAAQVAHHMEDEYWERWNSVMREELPKHQVERGRESGSWDPNMPTIDRWGSYGGRLYVTCLSICMLEVYYRHLPLYSRVYDCLGVEDPPVAASASLSEPRN